MMKNIYQKYIKKKIVPTHKKRRNHQRREGIPALIKDEEGLYPCFTCQRKFKHAPAYWAHSKTHNLS